MKVIRILLVALLGMISGNEIIAAGRWKEIASKMRVMESLCLPGHNVVKTWWQAHIAPHGAVIVTYEPLRNKQQEESASPLTMVVCRGASQRKTVLMESTHWYDPTLLAVSPHAFHASMLSDFHASFAIRQPGNYQLSIPSQAKLMLCLPGWKIWYGFKNQQRALCEQALINNQCVMVAQGKKPRSLQYTGDYSTMIDTQRGEVILGLPEYMQRRK